MASYALPTAIPHSHHGAGHMHTHSHSPPTFGHLTQQTTRRADRSSLSGSTHSHSHDREHDHSHSHDREDSHNHSHNHSHSHDHDHDHDHDHSHSHSHGPDSSSHSHLHSYSLDSSRYSDTKSSSYQAISGHLRPKVPAALDGHNWKSAMTPGGKHVVTPSQSSFDIPYDAPAPHRDHESPADRSWVTNFLLPRMARWPLIHAVLVEKDSRRIFYFMSINFSFMMVQAFYGYATDSLGLLSDSIHMLFDCVALAVGLFASVASKWAPNEMFPYGFGKIETLSGFANGVFLIHSHSHSHDHGHDHGHDQDHGHDHGHDKSHSHGDAHDNENMMGIYLHVLADTLGSAAVIVSTVLTHFWNWAGWDPLASFLIAVLILGSAMPLVRSSARRLLLTVPDRVEYALRDTLSGITGLRGVANYSVPKFWLDDRSGSDGPTVGPGGDRLLGVMHVVAVRGADMGDVRDRVRTYLAAKGIDITVQVEREGDSSCWCGVGRHPLAMGHKASASVI
ncbi:hypothetical protein RB595_000244 [Gaeumannomyces hyphopodioides]